MVVCRYLNDHPNLFISLMKVLGDSVAVSIARTRGVRVLWLCHNVDRETETYWPGITAWRRGLWSRAAETILVPDPALMSPAIGAFLGHRDKLRPITVGPLPTPTLDPEEQARLAQVKAFLNAPSDGGRKPLRLLVAGTPGRKYLHFSLLPRLCDALEHSGWAPRVVVAGQFDNRGRVIRGEDYRKFLAWCRDHDNIHLETSYLPLDERELADSIDLIWRSIADWSFAFTLFNAALARIPILTYEAGFLGSFVPQQGLGATIAWDFSNVDEAVRDALHADPQNFERFLTERSWERGGALIVAALSEQEPHVLETAVGGELQG
ncbi:hypothetical protein ACNSTU_11235 [Aquisalimonas sp. APHAB1-3]|uniref:hypothetical protein n=1 Tax=Aquisalimonas sp. APHAB1-3 TaxID=3402080 RepID=UPI003AAD2EB5